MGWLGRRDPQARGRVEGERILRQAGEREQRAARAMAARAGYDVTGAEHVAYEAPRGSGCLVVRADRIDLYDGEAHDRVWRSEVVAVRMEEGQGLLAGVEVVGPHTVLRVDVPRTQARLLHRLLTDRGPAAAPGVPASHLELLRQLSAMQAEGLISEAEFTAKKADILGRM